MAGDCFSINRHRLFANNKFEFENNNNKGLTTNSLLHLFFFILVFSSSLFALYQSKILIWERPNGRFSSSFAKLLIWKMNTICSHVFLRDNLVVTPYEGLPKINSLGWEEIYLNSLGSVWEVPSFCSIFVSSCPSSLFSYGASSCLYFDDFSYNSSSASSSTTTFS